MGPEKGLRMERSACGSDLRCSDAEPQRWQIFRRRVRMG